MLKKAIAGVGVATVATVAMSGTAFADHCTNISKDAHNPGGGTQLTIDVQTEEIVSANPGVLRRIDQGVIDPATGAGFHGLVGLDLDGDGAGDVTTFIVGPEGDALPQTAIDNGSPDHGIVDISTVLGP
jgi:hypothetical protein